MKKLVSIVLCFALIATLTVFNISAKRLYGEDFVALQVKEGNCELIDNSETNNLAHNQPIGFYTSSHGTGCNSQGDLVKFANVKLDKAAVKVAIKGGYNDSNNPGTAVEFHVYLNKVEGEPIAKISISDEETSSSRIANQIFKYADVNVAPGTYDVYIETASTYSGSFSEVAFIYEGKELDLKWKDDENCIEFDENGDEIEKEEYIKYSYSGLENVVYISDEGNDMNDGLTAETPVKTFLMASVKLAEGEVGTYIITDTVTVGVTNLPAGNYYGYDSNSRIELEGSNTRLGGDCTFNNIRIRANVDWTSIVCNGHTLVMGENVTTEKADGVVQYPCIVAGGHRSPVYEGAEVVLKSGEYHYIEGNTNYAAFNGNSHVTIYDKVKARMFIVGSAYEEYPQNGTSTFKFVGESINVDNPETANPIGLMDTMYIDLTEYTGDKSSVKNTYFADVDCVVLTDPDSIPENALPRSAVADEEEEEEEPVEADVIYTIGSTSAKPGDSVEVTLSVASDVAVNGLLLNNLTYDEDVFEFVGLDKFGDLITTSALGANGVDSANGVISLGYTESVKPNGQICVIKFLVKDTAEDGEYIIGIDGMASVGGQELSSRVDAGKITVSKWMSGDFDNNDVLDMKDVVYFMNWVNFSWTGNYTMAYDGDKDFNKDGNVDMKDVVYFMNWVNFSWTGNYDINW